MVPSGEEVRVFETHLRTYLINNGVLRGDAEQVDASAVLDSARSVGGEAVPPLGKTVGHPAPEFQLRLQQFLLSQEISAQTVVTLTPDHLLASVKEALASNESVLPSTETADPSLAAASQDQAVELLPAPLTSGPTKRDTTPIDSVLASGDDDLFGETPTAPTKASPTPSNSDSDYEDDDEPITHHGRRGKGIAQKSPRTSTTTTASVKAPKHPQTSSLTNLHPSSESPYTLHRHTLHYITFLHNHFHYLGTRFAAICLTLDRSSRSDDATAIAQYAVNLLGQEIFEAFVVHFEGLTKEGDSVESAKMCLADLCEVVRGGYGWGAWQELRGRIIGTGMRWGWGAERGEGGDCVGGVFE